MNLQQLQLEGMATEDQESMETGSTHQEGGPATPMEDSMCGGDIADAEGGGGEEGTASVNTGGEQEGDPVAVCTEEGDENIPYDKKWVVFSW